MTFEDNEPENDEMYDGMPDSQKNPKTTLFIFASLLIVSLVILFLTYGLSIIDAFNGSFSFVFGYVIGLTFRYISEGSFLPIIGLILFFISIWQIVSCWNKLKKEKKDEESV